jgi:DNA-binding GntR family transcriptional regulator
LLTKSVPISLTSYDGLREAIVRGDLGPNARLVESDIGTTFQMSRGAVRNALIRLEQEGLVVREPHRGARVRQVSDGEAVEILQARAVLEGLAAREAAQRIDDASRARLEACLARHRRLLELGDLLGASDANADLHSSFVEISCHGTYKCLISAIKSQTLLYQ